MKVAVASLSQIGIRTFAQRMAVFWHVLIRARRLIIRPTSSLTTESIRMVRMVGHALNFRKRTPALKCETLLDRHAVSIADHGPAFAYERCSHCHSKHVASSRWRDALKADHLDKTHPYD